MTNKPKGNILDPLLLQSHLSIGCEMSNSYTDMGSFQRHTTQVPMGTTRWCKTRHVLMLRLVLWSWTSRRAWKWCHIWGHVVLTWSIFIAKREQKGFFRYLFFGYTLSFQDTARWSFVGFGCFCFQGWFTSKQAVWETLLAIRYWLYIHTCTSNRSFGSSTSPVGGVTLLPLTCTTGTLSCRTAAVNCFLNMSDLQSETWNWRIYIYI